MGRSESGSFVCEARNAFGIAKLNSRVLVEEAPDPPFDLKTIEVGSRGASVRWAHPHTGNLPISKYVVHWKRDAGKSLSSPLFPSWMTSSDESAGDASRSSGL